VPWPRRRTESTRRVVLDLGLGQLESDEMLEGCVGDRGADRRVGQRIDRRLGLARLARSRQDLAHIGRQGRRAPVHPHRRLQPSPGVDVARREVQHRLADALGDDVRSALQRHIEIGHYHLPRRAGIAPQPDDREGRGRDDVGSGVLAGRADIGNRRRYVDCSRIGAALRIEQRDITGAGGYARDRTGAANGIDAATILGRDVAGVPAGAEQDDGTESGETKLH